MDNLNFTVLESAKLEELLLKVNQVYELLKTERVNPDSKIYSNAEAAKYLKACTKTLQNYRDNGQIRFMQIGRKIYYTQSQLDEFLALNKRELFNKPILNF